MSGIAVSVIDPKGQTETSPLVAKKVPLITMDNDAPDTGRLCYVGVDNYEAGQAVGRLVKKALPERRDDRHVHRQYQLGQRPGPDQRRARRTRHPGGERHPGQAPAASPRLSGKLYGKYFLVDGEAKTDGGPGSGR